ncbi:MAG: DsbA family protein [Deltaproteobacteria bacterium]|nr:DsbA family protein [Deltaproteobacteria bacterium]
MSSSIDASRHHPAISVAAVLEASPEHDEAPVLVEVFTDPFSAWCWGNQPDWVKLCETFGSFLQVRFRMVGLIRDTASGERLGGGLSDPHRMAMQWEEIAHLTRMPLDADRWLEAPPMTSWPACAAIAAALAADPVGGELYLRRCREAVICHRKDLADATELLELAGACDLDVDRLARDLESGAAGALFKADLDRAAALGGVSCPTYHFSGGGGVVTVRGSRPFQALVAALSEAYDDALPLLADPADVENRSAYARSLASARGSITVAEFATLLDIEPGDAADFLDRQCAGGNLVRQKIGRVSLYSAP